MRKRLSHGLLFVAGLFATQPLASVEPISPNDPRLVRLREFLKNRPAAPMAEEFLRVSDSYELDWRLLPSIAMVESGAGQAMRGNNLFGWNCGRHRFASIRHAIQTVAKSLATSTTYRHKDMVGKLETYNPGRQYPVRVLSVMRALGPADYRVAAVALSSR